MSESKIVGTLLMLVLVGLLLFFLHQYSPPLDRKIFEARWAGYGIARDAVDKAKKQFDRAHERAIVQLRADADREFRLALDERDAKIEECESRGSFPTFGYGFEVVCVKSTCVEKLRQEPER